LNEPFDQDAARRIFQREPFDHDAIQRIIRRAHERRAREWRVAWGRTLRAVRLCCGTALIALGRRLAGSGAMQPARIRRGSKARA
jgi:hypothetical protein